MSWPQAAAANAFTQKLWLVSSTDPEEVLSVSIPLEEPPRLLLGGAVVLPCYFEVSHHELIHHHTVLKEDSTLVVVKTKS